ncbi:MAG: NAD(P)-dependent oxidoreductase [Acidobacteriota bacterium]|nr:NAD(P)-dependent oxidoreductase [Acidobacteriota bacterium]MDE3170116.1 NAD(P)-dependent oxidoreductase [Acidobacteriota bacterium]
MTSKPFQKIGIVGFGEVGGIFGRDLAGRGIDVAVYDVLLRAPSSREAMLAKARGCGVKAAESLAECLAGRELIVSAVTASSAAEVAEQSAPLLVSRQIYLDVNSVSPETKSRMAERFEKSAAEFVEAAVMAAVSPQRLKVPMLLGGRYAAELAPRLASIGMSGRAVSDRVGIASATKMCRSVIIKGLEALVVESMFAARRYGAEDAVLASLAATYPDMGWHKDLPDYLISRVAEHGRRRAAEMREAAQAVSDVGLDPHMARATAARQDWLVDEIAANGLKHFAGENFSWRELADAINASQKPGNPAGWRFASS